jgi:hypothetical protein
MKEIVLEIHCTNWVLELSEPLAASTVSSSIMAENITYFQKMLHKNPIDMSLVDNVIPTDRELLMYSPFGKHEYMNAFGLGKESWKFIRVQASKPKYLRIVLKKRNEDVEFEAQPIAPTEDDPLSWCFIAKSSDNLYKLSIYPLAKGQTPNPNDIAAAQLYESSTLEGLYIIRK